MANINRDFYKPIAATMLKAWPTLCVYKGLGWETELDRVRQNLVDPRIAERYEVSRHVPTQT